MLDLDPNRPPVTPKDAATIVVLRNGDDGVEMFCVERHRKSGFMGGAIVFPGGKVDGADSAESWGELTTGLSERAASLAPTPVEARAFAVAAVRELLEEAAMLPVADDAIDDASAQSLRADWESASRSSASFESFIRGRDLRLDTRRLEALSRWVTPTAEARRFDARFYVMRCPEGQRGAHDRRETTESFWASPRRILARWEAGEIMLAPPTSRTIQLLEGAAHVDEAIQIARREPLEAVCPHLAPSGDRMILALPGDPLYPEEHPSPSAPIPTRFVLESGRFVPGRFDD